MKKETQKKLTVQSNPRGDMLAWAQFYWPSSTEKKKRTEGLTLCHCKQILWVVQKIGGFQISSFIKIIYRTLKIKDSDPSSYVY